MNKSEHVLVRNGQGRITIHFGLTGVRYRFQFSVAGVCERLRKLSEQL